MDSLQNVKIRFSEKTFSAKSIANWDANEKTKFALGIEYAHDTYGAGWGKNADNGFKMGDSSNIVSSGTSQAVSGGVLSGYVNGTTVPVYAGDGWSTDTFSLVGESNFEFSRLLSLNLSGRGDKNSYTHYLFSPRVATVSQVGDTSYLKFIWQNSKRMNTAEQLWLQHQGGNTADPEVLTTYEISYTTSPIQNVFITGTSFYNDTYISENKIKY